ncbi:hypothetical protein K438DRAFT_1760385 [Mycena galopus ATCC 62051]|nr:hypothetical protein K438DRAFT_1760385 [Mycena galopus ATCC 62051]
MIVREIPYAGATLLRENASSIKLHQSRPTPPMHRIALENRGERKSGSIAALTGVAMLCNEAEHRYGWEISRKRSRFHSSMKKVSRERRGMVRRANLWQCARRAHAAPMCCVVLCLKYYEAPCRQEEKMTLATLWATQLVYLAGSDSDSYSELEKIMGGSKRELPLNVHCHAIYKRSGWLKRVLSRHQSPYKKQKIQTMKGERAAPIRRMPEVAQASSSSIPGAHRAGEVLWTRCRVDQNRGGITILMDAVPKALSFNDMRVSLEFLGNAAEVVWDA